MSLGLRSILSNQWYHSILSIHNEMLSLSLFQVLTFLGLAVLCFRLFLLLHRFR